MTKLRRAIAQSKFLKLPDLKQASIDFSEFRPIITAQTISSIKSLDSVFNSSRSYRHVYNPRLFKNLGSIDGLTLIFKLFFENVKKEPDLVMLYGIDFSDQTAVVNLRRKYTYMLASMLAATNMWNGGSIREIHQKQNLPNAVLKPSNVSTKSESFKLKKFIQNDKKTFGTASLSSLHSNEKISTKFYISWINVMRMTLKKVHVPP